jgi:hypothetical protein
MRNTPGKSRRALGLGVAIVTLTALACLGFASLRDPAPVSLAQLSSSETVLMSCADEAPVSEALLWCSDPSSPQCIPAAPAAPGVELWDSPHVASLTVAAAEQPHGYVLRRPTWVRVRPSLVAGRHDIEPLERPPRS